ncbi:hypothetical protein G9A89_006758 [Geosiphon pyriformis]|nr:hypothetical protein G9A89_006758 [Geosiphon pyriformis]
MPPYFLGFGIVSFKRIARFAIDTSYAYCTSHNEIGALLKRSEVKADVFRDQKTKNIIVFFKGAIYNLDQWKTRTICLTQYPEPQNAKMWKWDPKNLVDERWLQDVETMKPRLFEKIWKMVKFANRITPYSAERLHFVGHGIGGAYAVLAGLAFKLKYHTISPLGTRNPNSVHAVAVTFGQPRLGNRYFAEFVDEVITVVRITHTNDYVPRFPPKKNTFQHSGSEFWLSNESCDCPGPDSGYDSQKDYESYGLYYCPRGTDKSENKLCNAGQEIEEIQSKSAHLGPYVNIVMGDCSKNPEVAQFLDT